jgi:hypothetical protein
MSVKKFLSAIAILMLMLFMVMASAGNVRAQQSMPLDSMWVSPSAINYSTNNATVGTLFNLTVWANMENGTYDWQVTLNFDASVFQEVAAGYSAGTTSAYFATHQTIPVTPVVDNVGGSILFGESLIGSTDYVPEENASLMYAEFNITSMPTTTTPITGIFDINATGLTGTFFDAANGTTVASPANLYDASFTLSVAVPPTISSITQVPDVNSVNYSEAVAVSANVTDNSGTGIANATIVYSNDTWATNSTAAMTLNSTDGLYYGTIPGYPYNTTINYVIDAYDNSGGFSESMVNTTYGTYTVLPEYAALSFLLIIIAMLAVAIVIARKKHGK